MQFSLRFNVIKGRSLPPWRYEFITPPGSLQPRSDAKGYFVHTALGPDLMTNAKNAVRGVIDWLGLPLVGTSCRTRMSYRTAWDFG
jgi:hypothetical protein